MTHDTATYPFIESAPNRKPTRTFVAGYNAGLQHAFKSEVAR